MSSDSNGNNNSAAGEAGATCPGSSALPPPHKFDESLLEAFRYIQATRGKDVRGKMLDCFNYWFQIQDTAAMDAVKSIVADLHNASLLVDDIEDNSTLRRGIPVAHQVYGVPIVLNTANYVYFSALEKCVRLNNPACTNIFVQELLNLHRGQGHDIQWRETLTCPTEEEYLSMILDKTGGLFRLAVGLLLPLSNKQTTERIDGAQAEAGAAWTSEKVMPLVDDLSVYFQIRDDLLNLVDPDMFELKTFADDLTEGKFSFPVMHHILEAKNDANGGDTRLLSILQQKSSKIELKRYAVQLMRESGSLQYTRDMCQVYRQKSLQKIQELGGNPALVKLVELLDAKLLELDDKGLLLASKEDKQNGGK